MNLARGIAAGCLLVVLLASAASAQAPWDTWPGVFDTAHFARWNFELTQANWATIRDDATFTVEVPALFHACLAGVCEAPILVAIRRKSAQALAGPPGPSNPLLSPTKVAFKVDVDAYKDSPSLIPPIYAGALVKGSWHNLKKFSLENGSGSGLVAEAAAWAMMLAAQGAGLFTPGYQVNRANFVAISVSFTQEDPAAPPAEPIHLGVYLSVEDVDKAFLERRGLWGDKRVTPTGLAGLTWLYKQDDKGPAEMKKPEPGDTQKLGPLASLVTTVCAADAPACADSPTVRMLAQYKPWAVKSTCTTRKCTAPPAITAAQLNPLVDMDLWAAIAAIGAFQGNNDDSWSNGKNYFWTDVAYDLSGGNDITAVVPDPAARRLVFPWDLDAVMKSMDWHVYGCASNVKGKLAVNPCNAFQAVFLGTRAAPGTHRVAYTNALSRLGPVVEGTKAWLDVLAGVPGLDEAFQADPSVAASADGGTKLGEAVGSLKAWLDARLVVVAGQVAASA